MAGGLSEAEVEASSGEERQAFYMGVPSLTSLVAHGRCSSTRECRQKDCEWEADNRTSMSHEKVLVTVPGNNKTPGAIRENKSPRAGCNGSHRSPTLWRLRQEEDYDPEDNLG